MHSDVCKHAIFVCVCVCVSWVYGIRVEERRPGEGCCYRIRVFVALCEAGSTLWGSPLGLRQSQCRIIHPGTKCVITMRKPPAPAPYPRTARPAGEVGRHSLAAGRSWMQAHTQSHAHKKTQWRTRTQWTTCSYCYTCVCMQECSLKRMHSKVYKTTSLFMFHSSCTVCGL